MKTNEDIHYYGKLRRRREFLKDINSEKHKYEKWEKWFNKCSNNNSLVPFLENRERQSSVWLFLKLENDVISFGLTAQSADMSGRKYPFLIYGILDKSERIKKEIIFQSLYYMVCRNQKFFNIVLRGSIEEEQFSYFKSTDNCSIITGEDRDFIEQISNNAIVYITSKEIESMSFWLNVNSLKYIEHLNAQTCSLYNKIYG